MVAAVSRSLIALSVTRDQTRALFEEARNQQRQVFDRLSVFADSFTVAAAQRVTGSGLDAAEVITGLVDRSMLSAQIDDPPTRYTMLDTLRHYGREQLDALGWTASTRLEHACYQVELTDDASLGLTGPDPGPWSKTIDHHLDDLRAAHNWSVQVTSPAPSSRQSARWPRLRLRTRYACSPVRPEGCRAVRGSPR